ncbi:MAG: hypothetical protein ABUS79_07415 [Pseudomonadota bacterium]
MPPRLRTDLDATTVDEQGVSCVEVTDPITAVSFRFYDFEYALALQLTGQPLAEVVVWAGDTYGVDLSMESLDAFVEKLAGLGFLAGAGSGAQPAVLVPSSASSGSEPFGGMTTTTVGEDAPLLSDVAMPDAFEEPVGEATFGNAVAPEGLLSGDATEYSLKQGGSGLWEQGSGQRRDAPLAAAPEAPAERQPRVAPGSSAPPAHHDVAAEPAAPPTPFDLPAPAPPALVAPAPAAPPALVAPAPAAPFDSAGTPPVAGEGEPPLPRLRILSDPLPPVPTPGGRDFDDATVVAAKPPVAPARDVVAPPAPRLDFRASSVASTTPPEVVAKAPPASASPAPVEAPRSATRPPVDLPPAVAATPDRAASPPVADTAAHAETPLASVAHFIVAESSALAPSGALDAGIINSRPPLQKKESPRVVSPAALPASSAWATHLAADVDAAAGGRRQPPRPEVVIMPPVVESAPSPESPAPAPHRRSSVLFVLLLLGAVGGGAAWFLRPTGGPEVAESSSAVVVHVVSPQPTAFYRWFDTVGVVVAGRDDTLETPTAGKLQDAMPPGTTFSAGETIARLQGVAARELLVNQIRSRIALYEQLRDSRRAEGSEAAARQAEAKLATRRQELAAAQAAQAELEIHPKLAGEIAELLVPKGVFIKAGTPVFRIRATGPRATFELPAADAARARALGFCRVETVPGSGGGADGGATETNTRAIDCSLSAAGAEDEGKLAVDLVGATVAAPGTQVRLASARYDGVFPVPRAALAHEGTTDRVWIATGSGGKIAESRVVELAATVDDLGLVSRGISVGDAVIVDPPASLRDGAEVNVAR